MLFAHLLVPVMWQSPELEVVRVVVVQQLPGLEFPCLLEGHEADLLGRKSLVRERAFDLVEIVRPDGDQRAVAAASGRGGALSDRRQVAVPAARSGDAGLRGRTLTRDSGGACPGDR